MSASKVTTNFLIVFLGLVFITQYTFGSVIPDGTTYKNKNFASKSCKESLPKEHFQKYEKLSKFTHQELGILKITTLELLKNFFEKIIESHDVSLKDNLEPIKKLSQEITEKEKTDDIFDAFATEEKAYNLLKQLNATLKGQPNKEADSIDDILKKFGLETLEKQFYEAGNKLSESFSTHVGEYRNSLTSEERAKDKNFDDWYAKLNQELDHCRKIKLFEEFFELYCTSNIKTF